MSKRHWTNSRVRRAIADIKKLRRGTRKLIKKTQERRGFLSEEEGKKMELCFFEQGKIKNFVSVATSSFMNKVLKVDKIWQRVDGFFVPIQFKSTQRYAEEYKVKFGDFLRKQFGQIPVIVVLSPGDKWEDIADSVLKRVNVWGGSFRFSLWQVNYNKFFDYEHHKDYGPSLKIRKRLFFKNLEIERQKEKQVYQPNPN